MMFPSVVIPLTAACKLAAFGTGGCAAMTGQNGCFVLWPALPRVCVKSIVVEPHGLGIYGGIYIYRGAAHPPPEREQLSTFHHQERVPEYSAFCLPQLALWLTLIPRQYGVKGMVSRVWLVEMEVGVA